MWSNGNNLRARQRGFSLVELIVVIGVIAILAALLMPALEISRENAQRVACASQLRQLGAAFEMYANSNSGSLPAWSGWHVYPHGSSPEDEPGIGWIEEMAPYLSPASPVYHCPSFPAKLYNYFLESEWAGVNGRHAIKLTDIAMTSRYVISAECTAPAHYPIPYGSSTHLDEDDDPDDYMGPMLLFPDDGGFLMHRGGTNVLFDDMHVEAFKAFDPDEMTFNPKKMESWSDVRAEGPERPN